MDKPVKIVIRTTIPTSEWEAAQNDPWRFMWSEMQDRMWETKVEIEEDD